MNNRKSEIGRWQQAKEFDRSRLRLLPLSRRRSDLNLDAIADLKAVPVRHRALREIARRIEAARKKDAAIILMMGAHVLRSGMQRYLIDLMEKGRLTHVAVNGAGVIHDFELALAGVTTESVARYVSEGQFGLWKETGKINDIVNRAARERRGIGESVGRFVEKNKLPHRDISLLAAGYRLGIPVTVHVGIGYDIVHEHPNCDGAAWGATSYRDFLKFATSMERLEDGVVMNFGSAVMAPEVYLKALAMVRNVARSRRKSIRRFATLVCDLVRLPRRHQNEPSRSTPTYYYRPLKTMLIRTVADGGASFYVRAPHAESIPQLWTALQTLR